MKKIGFACKISQLDTKKGLVSIPEYNSQATTVAWLNRQNRDVAVEKLWELTKYNIEAARKAVEYVGNLEENLRCFRLGSDILPVYTEPSWCWFYQQSDVRDYASRHFREVGALARKAGVRLSFHPGQFCCIVSHSDDVVTRSIAELEYHTDMARWMGYGKSKLDFKINVHLSGKNGVAAFDKAWNRMSPELRNCLTLENDEFQADVDTLIKLKHRVGIVLDLHHHFIKTGEYIEATDPRIQSIIESWCGVCPTIHYSVSREDLLGEHCRNTLPSLGALTEAGYKKSKLRSHSDYFWNDAVNKWALTHLSWATIMCESKSKNLASFALAKQAKELGFL